jgi:hypothetical protein
MEITIEKYQNIIKMLRSPDKESQVVGLTIIDELKFDENITQILLMMKHSEASLNTWEEHAPKIHKKVLKLHDKKIIGDINRQLTYKQILSAISKLKVKPEAFEFYMQDFSNYLLDQVRSMGYDFIESMDINIKYKEHEQRTELSKSE